MKVTIITITFNAATTLEKTMQSVLSQTCCDYEYLIIDGASKDGTMDLVKAYAERIEGGEYGIGPEQFRWVSESDKGLYDAMNKGIRLAQGEFIWFINSGDKIFDNSTLQKIVDAMETHPKGDVVYGQSLIIDEDDKPLGERHRIAPAHLTKRSLLDGLVVCHQSILVRRTIAPEYDLNYRITADYDWVCKVLDKSKENIFVDAYLSKFMSAGISSKRRKQALTERFRIMKKHFGLLPTLWSHFCILVKYPFVTKKHVY